MNDHVGFIGCGNMGGALVQAVCKVIRPEAIAVYDLDKEKSKACSDRFGVAAVDLQTVVSSSNYLFLGVKPQGLSGLFSDLRPLLQQKQERTVLITMAAGISIQTIEELAGQPIPIIRIMPNTPVSVGEGMLLYTCNQMVESVELSFFQSLLSAAGRLDCLPEEKIDAASALSGCGPAFVCLLAEGLADGAVECGLPRDKATLYAAQTLLGTAKLLLQSGKHSAILKDEVCSPGGTTIAGVHALEQNGFRVSAMDAVVAAYEKTLQMKKGM